MTRAGLLSGRRRWLLAAAPVAIGAVAATVVLTGASSASATYRTAAAQTGDVTQTLTATGAIASASQRDLAFQVDGTVAKVKVQEGDTVEAGDVLARLDTGDLEDAVTEANEALADAKEALAEDLEAQSEGSSTSSTSSSTTASSAAYSAEPSTADPTTAVAAVYVPGDTRIVLTAAGGDATSVEEARAALVAAQDALLDQYDVAQALLEAAQTASAEAQEICAAFTEGGTEDAFEGAAEGDADASAEALAACQEATDAALEASQVSIEAQATLMELAADVDAAVAALQEAIAADGGAAGGSDGGGSTDGSTGGDGGSLPSGDAGATGGDAPTQEQGGTSLQGTPDAATGGTTSDAGTATDTESGMTGSTAEDTVPSAADILADKADITAARAALKVAQQQVEHATLTAPVAGTVVSVAIAEDAAVTAGDTTAAITVVSDNSYLVELSVGLTEAQLLAVGQEAGLTLTSSGEVVDGVVSSVSNVNSGNDFAQAYAVTIAVADPGFEIRIGAATRMSITVAGATGVLVVPTSAVADAAGDATVQVVGEDGTATQAAIETGAVGAVYTEVTSGLEAGDEVILADLTTELTSGDEESEESSGLLGGLDSGSSETEDQQMQFPGGGAGGGMVPPGFAG
ncbi:biotin/lipoyl-binding protein [Demequina silvatica]|uniref:biotin/lipoyl-binding protein n=1 Tax=Demequina silvatica TaxID=1638988 RepID=UPI0007825006|nr:biotin/lipoyl-binding protein [Demequina silvatica]